MLYLTRNALLEMQNTSLFRQIVNDENVFVMSTQVIGKGGFGKVFAGERLRDRHPVAIKHINKSKISSWCTVSPFTHFYAFLTHFLRQFTHFCVSLAMEQRVTSIEIRLECRCLQKYFLS